MATAASATFPPDLSTSTPASVASGWQEATIPSRAMGACRCAYPICGTSFVNPVGERAPLLPQAPPTAYPRGETSRARLAPEYSRDLILREARHRARMAAGHGRH